MSAKKWGLRRRLLACGLTCMTLAIASESLALPPGFTEEVVLSGLLEPTAVAFSPDGRVFVAEKSGLIMVFPGLYSTTPSIFADLRTQVHNFWDRGLLGLALHPNFPATPYVYVLYTHDAPIGGTAPRWGTVGGTFDDCPTPPGATTSGCVVSGRLSRLEAAGNGTTGAEVVLVEGWCQQFPSHSIGALAFASDGALIVSGGDGASFDFVDYGQTGIPLNPCGDPPVPVGGTQTPPTAAGGSLRSESVERLLGDPRVLNGAILRLDPITGLAMPDNPLVGSPSLNERRIIAFGLRNPFRLTTRPGTQEIWVGDVGWNNFEEINRVIAHAAPVENFAWPCYEGAGRQSGYDNAGLNICESLYGRVGAATPPVFEYNHSAAVVSGDQCPVGSSAVSGLAFYNGGTYPPEYSGALFFADHARECIWAMLNPASEGGSTPALSYAFNEGAGAVSQDLSGNNHPASLVGGATWTGGGVSGSAVQLNGTTGYLSVASPGTSSGDFTASIWVKAAHANTFQAIMERLDSSSRGWELTIEPGGRLTIHSNGLPRLTTSSTLPLNVWTYLTVRRQGGTWTLFVNGVPRPETGVDGTAFSFGSCPLTIGLDADIGCSGALNGYLQGEVDEVRLYNRALSQAEIQADMTTPVTPTSPGPGPTSIQPFTATASEPVDLKIGPNGDVFYVDFGGSVRRLRFGTNQAPTALAQATPTSGPLPLAVSFDGTGSNDPDPGDVLTYAWDLDGDGQFDDSAESQTVATYDEDGVYSVRLRVEDNGEAFSVSSPIVISAGTGTPNAPPTATIDSPTAATTWEVGEVVSFSGHATDPEDGPLPASAMTWALIMQHCPSNCHTHHITDLTGIASGTFTAPDHEYPSHLELQLTVTDSDGASDVKSVLLQPRTVSLTFQTSPSGLQLTVGGASGTTPFSRTAIVGSQNSLVAPSPQTLAGSTYQFASWSDGGAQTHNITASATSPTYGATYQTTGGPPPPPANARLAYGFNEGSGTTSADLSGNNLPATLVGGVSWTSAAVSGNAVQLNGSTGYVRVPSPGLSGSDFTASAWVYPTRGTGFQAIMEMLTPASTGWEFAIVDGRLSVWSNAVQRLTTAATVPLNTWSYLTIRRQGSALTVFINAVAQPEVGIDPTVFSFGSCPFHIGVDADSGCTGALNGHLQGRIDGVRVYNRALTVPEIQVSMASGDGTGALNAAPTATIDSPTAATTWEVGEVVSFSGHATDPEDGPLPASAMTWALILHDCPSTCQAIPLTNLTGIASGTFTAPDHAYPSHLELQLTVTDSGGASDVKSVLLQPRTVSLTFQTSPSGLQLTVGGANGTTPFSRTVIMGSQNSLVAPSPQTLAGSTYQFASWSDGGAQTHNITASATSPTYGATYQATGGPPPPPANARLAYGFNEGSGTTSADLSGNNLPATLVGGVSWTSAAVSGNAVQLNGSTGYVRVPSPGLSGSDFTASAWVYPTRGTGFQAIMEMLTPASTGWEFAIVNARLSVWSNAVQRLTTAATVPLNTWSYLTIRRQGSALTVFINAVAQPEVGTDPTVFSFGSCPFHIGVDADSGCTGALNGHLQGRIDGVRVYNRSLTAQEIQATMGAVF
jgi:glucose/arabinose dehydrogenase/PKD repeat protein